MKPQLRMLLMKRAARAHKYRNNEDFMTIETQTRLECFFASFSKHVAPLLLLDYDGTLAPFRVDRSKAHPFKGVREVIASIQAESQTRIVVITGRHAKEISPLLRGVPPVVEQPVEVWGLHGSERLHADGRCELEQPEPETQRTLDQVREYLRHNNLGGEFEDKPNAAVMHWRGASPRTARFIEQRTREVFEPLAMHPGLRLLEFENGLELRAGRDKGDAVQALAAEVPAGTPIAYLGDDYTDESAFRAVNQYDGPHLSALVKPAMRETDAEVWLRPPSELRSFLKRWLKAAPKDGRQKEAPAFLQALTN
jgi:trehalose 6-phosphate synthase/trehalose 6-phosphate phosphatase